MTIEMLIEKSIRGFDGSRFLLSYYNGESYISLIDDRIFILSQNAINEKSIAKRDGYLTEVIPEELTDITLAKLYVTYRGKEYEALMVSKGFEKIIIKARKGFEYEDKKIGFEDNIHERLTTKQVTRDEIEAIRVEENSVYMKIINNENIS